MRLKRAVIGAALAVSFAGGALVMGSTQPGGAASAQYKVVTKHVTVPIFQLERINVVCPAGMVPVGGGAHLGIGTWPRSDENDGYVAESSIDLAGNGWETTVVAAQHEPTSSFTVVAICAVL